MYPHQWLYCLVALIAVLLPMAAARPGLSIWHPIPVEDLSGPKLKLMGEFAVHMNNGGSKNKLVFEKVVRGEKLLMAVGMNYRLEISARNELRVPEPSSLDYPAHAVRANYEAVVHENIEKAGEDLWKLTSFRKLTN